eukprot:3763888-Pyramimonas_sp.AAC.1
MVPYCHRHPGPIELHIERGCSPRLGAHYRSTHPCRNGALRGQPSRWAAPGACRRDRSHKRRRSQCVACVVPECPLVGPTAI